jgi:hypothetical protein
VTRSVPGADEVQNRSEALHALLQAAMSGTTSQSAWTWSDDLFNDLACAVFSHQYASCAPYRRYCVGRGVTPDSLAGWEHIPAVPTEVFKSMDLFAFPSAEATTTFLTSGTRFGSRGRHLLRTDSTYLASLAPWLDRFLLCGLPDGSLPRVFVLAPPRSADPGSSLSHMLQWAYDERGAPESRFFWSEDGPGLADCASALEAAASTNTPILLLATSGALEGLLDSTAASWTLPEGSVVMETGGPKASGMAFDRSALHSELSSRLGVPIAAVVSEYGMTELGSQGYSPSWLRAVDPEAALRWPTLDPDLHVFPPWCRVRALSPDDLGVLPHGARGLLCYWDLSNIDSVLCVLTADEGVVEEAGVRMLGRSVAATPRGCSLAVEEILGASP